MKKTIVLLVGMLLISAFVISPLAFAQEGENVTIELWQHDSGGKITGMASVIEGFNELYPNVEVVQTVIPYDEYQTKIAASVPAGTGPDVAMIYFGWAPLWSKSGFIAPLPAEVQAVLESDFAPFTQITKLKGDHYAVPTSIRNFALFYNTTLMAEAGWDTPPATWEEFVQAAKDCTKYDGDGNITQAGYYLAWDGDGWNWWRPLIQAFGGQPFSEDNTTALWNEGGAVEAWQYMLVGQLARSSPFKQPPDRAGQDVWHKRQSQTSDGVDVHEHVDDGSCVCRPRQRGSGEYSSPLLSLRAKR